MVWLFFLTFGGLLAGAVLAVVWWFVRGRRDGLPSGPVAGFTLAAGGLGLLLHTIFLAVRAGPLLVPIELPFGVLVFVRDARFAIPLVIGVLALVLLAFPVRPRSGGGVADLTPRGPFSCTRTWHLVVAASITGVAVLTAVLAGAASQPDPTTGRYTMYFLELGGENGMGTGIYGWFYSVPALVAIAFLMAVAVADLVLIARPALDEDRAQDIRVRTVRTRNVIAVATGALLLHLGPVFSSLAGTASLRASMATDLGRGTFWTPMAALQPVFHGAALVAETLGVMLWVGVTLTAVGVRRESLTAVSS